MKIQKSVTNWSNNLKSSSTHFESTRLFFLLLLNRMTFLSVHTSVKIFRDAILMWFEIACPFEQHNKRKKMKWEHTKEQEEKKKQLRHFVEMKIDAFCKQTVCNIVYDFIAKFLFNLNTFQECFFFLSLARNFIYMYSSSIWSLKPEQNKYSLAREFSTKYFLLIAMNWRPTPSTRWPIDSEH